MSFQGSENFEIGKDQLRRKHRTIGEGVRMRTLNDEEITFIQEDCGNVIVDGDTSDADHEKGHQIQVQRFKDWLGHILMPILFEMDGYDCSDFIYGNGQGEIDFKRYHDIIEDLIRANCSKFKAVKDFFEGKGYNKYGEAVTNRVQSNDSVTTCAMYFMIPKGKEKPVQERQER